MYKVTFSGIDGSGRSTTIDALSKRLSDMGLKVVHPHRPAFADLPGCDREYFYNMVNTAVDSTHRFLDNRNQRFLTGLLNMGYGWIHRAIERYAIRRYDPDVILVGRNLVLDSAVYCTYYFPVSRSLSPKERIRIASSTYQAKNPDIMLYMDVDPTIAYERILKRIEDEKKHGAKDRKKWTHMHENPEDLKFLRDGFEVTLEFLVQQNHARIVRVDASRPQNEVIDGIFSIIQNDII